MRENCLRILKTICIKTCTRIFPKLSLKLLRSFNILIVENVLPYQCVNKCCESFFVKIVAINSKDMAYNRVWKKCFLAIMEKTIATLQTLLDFQCLAILISAKNFYEIRSSKMP